MLCCSHCDTDGFVSALDTRQPDAPLGLPSSRKRFGGSLRRLLGLSKRSSSGSRYKSESNYGTERRLSVEGSRPEHHGSRSSVERGMTPPHHRTLSPSSSYGYRSPSSGSDAPHRSETINIGGSISVNRQRDSPVPYYGDDARRYSLPSQQRGSGNIC